MVKNKIIPIKDILIKEDIYPRESVSDKVTQDYFMSMKKGDIFPNIDVAKYKNAFWLIDVVMSYQPRPEEFQIWNLKLVEGGGCVVTMQEDTNKPIKVKQEIGYTDFPEDIKLYFQNGVLFLPSEY